MRSIRFAGMHRVLKLVAEYPEGIRAGELNREVVARELYRTARGAPGKSTLYHCRNTLLHLGAVYHSHQRLFAAAHHSDVAPLLQEPAPIGEDLSDTARHSFGTLVLKNRDCVRNFFRLFIPAVDAPSPTQFMTSAKPVLWSQPAAKGDFRTVELRSMRANESIVLGSPIEIQSVLYGVRYWARDELCLIDEFFETGRGSVMYPIRVRGLADPAAVALDRILRLPRDAGDWTTVSVNALLRRLCEEEGYPLASVFDAIRRLVSQHPGHVTLIPTIPNIAAISATSRHRETFELRAYFVDAQKRLISHVRFHNSL